MKILPIIALLPLASCGGGGTADPPPSARLTSSPPSIPSPPTSLQINRPITYFVPGDPKERFVALYPPDQVYASVIDQGNVYVFRGTLAGNLFSGLWCEITPDTTYPLGEFAALVSVDSTSAPVIDASNVGFTWSGLEVDPRGWMGDEPLCVDMVFP